MANFLDSLLAAVNGQDNRTPWARPGTSGVYQTPPIKGPPQGGDDEVIEVMANEQPQRQEDLSIPAPPPVRAPKIRPRLNDNSTNRPGMFGVRGTLRDVLGLLGDSLIKGPATPYQTKRQQERVSDSLVGFADNPQEFLKAINRVADTDPEFAAKLFQVGATQQSNQANRESMDAARKSQIEDRDYKRKQDFGNWAGQVLAYAPDKVKAMQSVATRAAALGFDLAELGIGADAAEDLGRGATKMNTQVEGPRKDRQLDISQQNADANTTRANRPPSNRTPQPTNAALAAPLIAKLAKGGTLTPQDDEVLNRLGYSKNRGQGGGKYQVPELPKDFFKKK